MAARAPVRLRDRAPVPVTPSPRGKDQRTRNGSAYVGGAPRTGAPLDGVRLHVTTTRGHVVDDWLLAPASVHDRTPMTAGFVQAHDRLVLGAGALPNPTDVPLLHERRNIPNDQPPAQRQPPALAQSTPTLVGALAAPSGNGLQCADDRVS